MVRLWTLFTEAELNHAVTERLVVRRQHATEPLAILNYTERCQHEPGLWSPLTMACRGIIYRTDTHELVARPFRKFFNYGQAGAPEIGDEPVAVTDKLDGSLGIVYPTSSGYAVATRGSFDGEQAVWATAYWRRNLEGFTPPAGLTLLTEIIYPANRIVVDYGDTHDLILLGAVEIVTGRSLSPYDERLAEWPGRRAQRFVAATLADALALPTRPNAEGIVIHALESDERVKVKQEDYVKLHRIVTGLNEKVVWEHLSEGKPLGDLLAPVPDELHGWVCEVADGLVAQIERNTAEVETAYSAILAALPPEFTRKDFALKAKDERLAQCLFARLDGKDYRPMLWKLAKPAGVRAPRVYSEDGA